MWPDIGSEFAGCVPAAPRKAHNHWELSRRMRGPTPQAHKPAPNPRRLPHNWSSSVFRAAAAHPLIVLLEPCGN